MRQMSAGQIPMPMVFAARLHLVGTIRRDPPLRLLWEFGSANTPGLKVVVPSTPYMMRKVFEMAKSVTMDIPWFQSEQNVPVTKGESSEGNTLIPLWCCRISNEKERCYCGSLWKDFIKEALSAAEELLAKGRYWNRKWRFTHGASNGLSETILATSVKRQNRLEVPWSSFSGPFASVASEITYIVQERAFDFPFWCAN